MVSFDTKSYSKKLLHLISWSHWFTFFNIVAAIALSSYYLFHEAAPTTVLGYVYLLTTWVSHIAFLTFMSFVLILFPLTLVFPHTRFIRTSGSIIFTLGLLLLVLDAFIYSKLGYHLNASSSEQIVTLIKDIAQQSGTFYLISGTLAILILSFQFVVSNYAWKHLKQLQKTVFARYVVFGLVASFFFSHLTHIWADANLKYDILSQDTVLPLSYPATAKTLLTKYDLFNIDDYIERKNSPLSFSKAIPSYPTLDANLCNASKAITNTQSVFIILTDAQISAEQLRQFKRRSTASTFDLKQNIDTGVKGESWFNLLYSLPSIYQQDILKQKQKPLLFQQLANENLVSTLTVINKTDEVTPQWFSTLFDKSTALKNVSSLLFADELNNKAPGLHVIYFKNNQINDTKNHKNQYQFELFIDALLLAQKQKTQKDIIWISAIGNDRSEIRLSTKPALLIYENNNSSTKHTELTHNTSTMDLQPTLMKHWLGCDISSKAFNNGSDLISLNKNRIIANTTEQGIIVFDKDKSVFIDQHGNFQSYSTQLSAPITINSDFPLMIDGVHFIKQFTAQK
jgi:membrane-anchored protein YejM (alkaline phosphatase superfamily)